MAGHGDREWSAGDTLATAAWFALALAARAPLLARIEGALDHDQSVVGLMALDIADGRRLPIFFDGQRYMGAVEAYVASAFVRAFGHAPMTVALAPWVGFGLFVAGQYAVWSRWKDRPTGHLAAGLSAVGSPMLALWGIVPRGGYVGFLAWALPTLAAYRAVTRPGRPASSAVRQAGWGFWLALGYFLNPLSLTVYATLALDWAFGRHGEEVRRARLGGWRWPDSRLAPLVWLAASAAWVTALAFCCHVDPGDLSTGSPYVVFGGLTRARWGVALGAAGVLALLGAAAWWSLAPARLYERLTRQPWTLLGVLAAWSPFVAHGVLVRAGVLAAAPSLPVWIAAPWKAGANVRRAAAALGPLVGCDPRAIETVLVGQGVEPPEPRWGALAAVLEGLSPGVIAVALGLLALAAWRERAFWARAFALRGAGVTPPAAIASAFLAVAAGLFALQGTSPNASAVRYLVPVWVALPGLLACGLRALDRRAAAVAACGLAVPWAAAQAGLWRDLDRPSPARPLAAELERRGVAAVVAPTPVALIVANLTHGAVGAAEFRPIWPRLGGRYAGRFRRGRPLTCVVDRRFPWAIRGEGAWAAEQDFGRHLRDLAARHPGRVRPAWAVDSFEVWEADLPLDVVLATDPAGEPPGAALAGRSAGIGPDDRNR